MPKTIHTPRDELVCGKFESVATELAHLGGVKQNTERVVKIIYTLADIKADCVRMENKLISRKEEVKGLREFRDKAFAAYPNIDIDIGD